MQRVIQDISGISDNQKVFLRALYSDVCRDPRRNRPIGHSTTGFRGCPAISSAGDWSVDACGIIAVLINTGETDIALIVQPEDAGLTQPLLTAADMDGGHRTCTTDGRGDEPVLPGSPHVLSSSGGVVLFDQAPAMLFLIRCRGQRRGRPDICRQDGDSGRPLHIRGLNY